MPSVTITRGTIANGQHQDPGNVVDLTVEDANRLVALGKAAFLDGSPAKGADLESLVAEPPKKGKK